MKVALKNIRPNPWRYINKGYPIDKAKVDKLRSSIKRTGFWDNLVGRKGKDGLIEIAYGHHRIEACRQEFKADHEIDVIVRDLDDATMLKIMAAENDALTIMSPAIINETVRAAMDFIHKSGEKPSNSAVGVSKKFHVGIDVSMICEFYDCHMSLVTFIPSHSSKCIIWQVSCIFRSALNRRMGNMACFRNIQMGDLACEWGFLFLEHHKTRTRYPLGKYDKPFFETTEPLCTCWIGKLPSALRCSVTQRFVYLICRDTF